MFDFFNNIMAFLTSIGEVIINFFKGLGQLVAMLLAVPEFFGTLYFLPNVLLSAVMLTVTIALLYMVLGRGIGGK